MKRKIENNPTHFILQAFRQGRDSPIFSDLGGRVCVCVCVCVCSSFPHLLLVSFPAFMAVLLKKSFIVPMDFDMGTQL